MSRQAASPALHFEHVRLPDASVGQFSDLPIDVQIAVSLHHEAQGFDFAMTNETPERFLRGHLQRIGELDARLVVSEEHDIHGFVACSFRRFRRTMSIDSLAIAPEVRGAGIGSHVLEMLLEQGRGQGARRAHVISLPGAIEFYQRHGFRPIVAYHDQCDMQREL